MFALNWTTRILGLNWGMPGLISCLLLVLQLYNHIFMGWFIISIEINLRLASKMSNNRPNESIRSDFISIMRSLN